MYKSIFSKYGLIRNLELSYSRLALLKALQIVIHNAIHLIAVSTTEKMYRDLRKKIQIVELHFLASL